MWNALYKVQLSELKLEWAKILKVHQVSANILLETHEGASRIIEVSFDIFGLT